MQFSLLLLSVIAAFANAIPSPAYLSVPNVNSCMGSENMTSFTVVCLPQAKPEDCPSSSWKQLTESTRPEWEQRMIEYYPTYKNVTGLLRLCSSAIPNFRSCTVRMGENKYNDYTYLCTPLAKPKDCPSSSWKQLTESTHLHRCALYSLSSFMEEIETGPGWLVLVGVLGLCGGVCMYLTGKKRRKGREAIL